MYIEMERESRGVGEEEGVGVGGGICTWRER